MGIWNRIVRVLRRTKVVEKPLCFRCPICSPIQFIEYIDWIPHLTINHKRETLAKEFPDVDLIYYLVGKNPMYGRPPPEEISDDAMRSRVGTKVYNKEMEVDENESDRTQIV